LKAGLVFADSLTTVSPTYAREIQESDERGFGFEGLLQHRSKDLHGILNGIDVESWNPEKDHFIAQRYGARDAAGGKAACKRAVREKCVLLQDAKKPLVAIVSRLDYQKGLDLAIEAIEPRLERCQLAVVGTGDAALNEAFSSLARRRIGAVHFHSGFDDPFAHELYAAADLFLMPSRFEPCGLGQMIAMRYGALPVAAKTGGLSDTVFERPEGGKKANGFLAPPGDAAALGAALDRALAAYGAPGWADLVRGAMQIDFSWASSVEHYAELYRAVAARARAAV
jgi:starch synthase